MYVYLADLYLSMLHLVYVVVKFQSIIVLVHGSQSSQRQSAHPFECSLNGIENSINRLSTVL